MAKLLYGDEWFEQIAPGALYETEYERLIVNNAYKLYPQYVAVPFKKTVYSSEDAARPDLILIEQSYRDWWIVEVEMSDHSLVSHVLPQVRTLATAEYGSQVASHICSRNPEFEVAKIVDMLKGKRPQILVVVNEVRQDWVAPLEANGAKVAFFEVFRSLHNSVVFRVNGYSIPTEKDFLSICQFDAVLPNFLIIESPAALNIPRNGTLTLRFNDRVSEWRRVDSSDMVWLVPVETNPIPIENKYELFRQEDGVLQVRTLRT